MLGLTRVLANDLRNIVVMTNHKNDGSIGAGRGGGGRGGGGGGQGGQAPPII